MWRDELVAGKLRWKWLNLGENARQERRYLLDDLEALPVNPRYSSHQALYKALKREFAKAGVELKRNAFHNCYISYRYAQPTESVIVADEAGTSKRMVENNYKALVKKWQARSRF